MIHLEKLDLYWRNLVEAFSKEFIEGAAVLCFPRVPLFLINHVAVISVNGDQILKLVAKAEQFFQRKGLENACFRVSPSTQPIGFDSLLKKQGYSSEGVQSIMVYTKNQVNANPNEAVSIRKVENNNDIDVFNRLLVTIFKMPVQWMEGFIDFTRESMRVGWQFYLGYLENKPVGISALFSSNGVGGTYDIATLEEYRGQGIGSTLTLYTLRQSFAIGNKMHTLQAENGGEAERLYQKLGFVTDHLVEFYSRRFVK